MSEIVIGVDAGGSKTRVLVSTLSGTKLAEVTGPGAAMAPGDAEHCASIIAGLVESALEEARKPRKKKKAKTARNEATETAEASPEDVDSEDVTSESDEELATSAEEQDSVAMERVDDESNHDESHDDDETDEEDESSPYADEAVASTPKRAQAASTAVDEDDEATLSAAIQSKPLMLFAGVAGTGREEEQIALQEALTRYDLAEEVAVDTDASVALADAFDDGAGIVLVAGTGSIAFGRGPSGIGARCGGWGLAIGDEGSGAWIGRKALSVIAAAHDGREPETALTGAILTAAQVNEPDELIPWSIAADKEALGALAPSVIAIAMQGDMRANAIIDVAVEELMLHVRALGKRLFIDERAAFEVALAGGLLRKGSLVRKRLERRLKQAVPGATIKSESIDGARGAVRLARHALTHTGV